MIRQHFYVLVGIDSFGSTGCNFLLKDKGVLLLVVRQPNKSHVLPNGYSTVTPFTFYLDSK